MLGEKGPKASLHSCNLGKTKSPTISWFAICVHSVHTDAESVASVG